MSGSHESKSKSNLYHVWYNMINRTDVKVCDSWRKNYRTFEKWCMDNGYKEGCRIYRIDKSKAFTPSNTAIKKLNYISNLKSMQQKIKVAQGKRYKVKMKA